MSNCGVRNLMRNSVLLLAMPFIILVVALTASPTFSERKVAPIIGNSNYQAQSSLENPDNDATALADAQRNFDFKITEKHGLARQDMMLALKDFIELAEGSERAVINYAGHGIEMNKTNYLILAQGLIVCDELSLFENCASLVVPGKFHHD